ncbi:MAG: glycosyltransferase family 10 [Rhodobacteraceae bacterium]|nr:glycosyltransferase family 10 [Paracoccaceae bacterium]
MSEPGIAVLPYGMRLGPRLAELPVSELIWPLGCPTRLVGANVGDLAGDDHLIVFPKTATHFAVRRGTKAQISLILGEPSVINAKHLMLLRQSHRRFWRVLSFNETLLGRIPNGIFFPLGTTWVPEWRDIGMEKTAMCSLIASSKRDSQGHKLRHETVAWARDTSQDVAVMGQGYAPFETKADGLARYRYSVVIENIREKNYFSEKLIDAVLCNTVPIYWGCPNLDRFVDTTGIIQCQTSADIRRAIAAMSAKDFDARLPQIQAIQPDLAQYCDLEKRAALAIRDSLR